MGTLTDVQKKEDVSVVSLTKDEISMLENETLKQEFFELIKAGAKKIVVNFSQVKFVSSVVLATLISILKEVKSAGGSMKLCSMDPKVKNVFILTELHKIFEIYDTEEEALKKFS